MAITKPLPSATWLPVWLMIRPTEGPRTAAAWVGSKPAPLWTAAAGGGVACLVVGLDFEADGEEGEEDDDVEQPASASAASAAATGSKRGLGAGRELCIGLGVLSRRSTRSRGAAAAAS